MQYILLEGVYLFSQFRKVGLIGLVALILFASVGMFSGCRSRVKWRYCFETIHIHFNNATSLELAKNNIIVDESFFPELDISRIVNLTAESEKRMGNHLNGQVVQPPIEDWFVEVFRIEIKLVLTDTSRENVSSTIKMLCETRDDIEFVDYYGEFVRVR